jgi:PKD repeat protein
MIGIPGPITVEPGISELPPLRRKGKVDLAVSSFVGYTGHRHYSGGPSVGSVAGALLLVVFVLVSVGSGGLNVRGAPTSDTASPSLPSVADLVQGSEIVASPANPQTHGPNPATGRFTDGGSILGFQPSTLSTTVPGAASMGSLAWDPAIGAAVYFGGLTSAGPSDDTWVLESGVWLNETSPGHAPPARWGASLAYDAQVGVETLVLFGGYGTAGPLNDTWLFINGEWTQVGSLGPTPEPLYNAAATSWGSNGTILFGGCSDSGCDRQSNQTWVFQLNASCRGGYANSCWVNLDAGIAVRGGPPPGLAAASIAVDPDFGPSDGIVVLYGGLNQTCPTCVRDSNATWYFDGYRWSDATTLFYGQPYPSEGRAYAALVWDPLTEWLYLYGGLNATSGAISNSLWSTDIDAWTNSSSESTPHATFALGAATGAETGSGEILPALLVGGNVSVGVGPDDSTWVYEPSVVNTVHVTPPVAETNATVNFYSNTSGGSHPSASWEFGDGAIEASGNSSHVYTRAGSYFARLTVTDAFGVQAISAVSVSVHSFQLGVQWPVAMDVGSAWNFTSVPTNGTAPFAFNWTFSDGATSDQASAPHGFSTPGPAWAELVVTDATGTVVFYRASFPVNAAYTGGITSSPSTIDVGATVLLFGSVSGGGSPPFVFNWSLPNGRTALGATIPYPATTVGNYSVGLRITDAAEVSWSGTLPLRVNPALTFVAHATTPGAFSGRSVSFTAVITGGTPTFSYAWYFGDGSSSTAADPTHVYHASGTFAVNVWVNDSGHGTYHQILEVKIPRSAGGLVWQLEEWPEWALLALAGAIVIVVLSLALVYRHRAMRARVTRTPQTPGGPPSR